MNGKGVNTLCDIISQHIVRTFVELPPQRGRKSGRHILISVHCRLNHIVVFNYERNLGIAVTLNPLLENRTVSGYTVRRYLLASVIYVRRAHLPDIISGRAVLRVTSGLQ